MQGCRRHLVTTASRQSGAVTTHGILRSISDPTLWLGGGMSRTHRLITQVTVPSILSRAQSCQPSQQATELRRLPERGQELHALAAGVLDQQLDLAPRLPRNYVLDQCKCVRTLRSGRRAGTCYSMILQPYCGPLHAACWGAFVACPIAAAAYAGC